MSYYYYITLKIFNNIIELYKKGIFEGDIKPDNISFSRIAKYNGFEPVLIDFGIAVLNYRQSRGSSPFYYYNMRSRVPGLVKINFATPE